MFISSKDHLTKDVAATDEIRLINIPHFFKKSQRGDALGNLQTQQDSYWTSIRSLFILPLRLFSLRLNVANGMASHLSLNLTKDKKVGKPEEENGDKSG